MKLFFSIFIAFLFLLGCSDDTTQNSTSSNENIASPAESSTFARNSKSSCFVDKGFENEVDCYEGESAAVKKICDSLPKNIPGSKITFSENSGCPTNRKYIGCCSTVESTQCYYLSDGYETKKSKDEWINGLKSDCLSYGDKWEK